jgi:hypothetical protein
MAWRWIRRGLAAEGLNALVQALGFGNPLGALAAYLMGAGVLVMGLLTARFAWVEGVIKPYGTLGYVGVILSVALVLTIILMGLAWSVAKVWPRSNKTVSGSSDVVPTTTEPALELIASQDFQNHYVVVDDEHFVSCNFRDCTVEYNGGPFVLTTCPIPSGHIRFVTRNPVIINTVGLLQCLQFMKELSGGEIRLEPNSKITPVIGPIKSRKDS